MAGLTDLAFRLFAIDEASPIFARVAVAAAAAGDSIEGTNAKSAGAGAALSRWGTLGAGAAVAIGAASVKMAGDFQEGITTLQTGAGESASNLKMVADGILNLAQSTGTSTKQLTDGMFMIESAGFHGAAGLDILKASAEGAKVGGADLGDTANAVTTILKDFSGQGLSATDATNALVVAVQNGKTHMADLAPAIATVAPAAATAGLKMTEMMGALADMTAHGMSADKAATSLRQTILQLEAPSAKASAAMKGVGLSAIDVSKNLGTNGLGSTIEMITNAIQSKMGPAGTVLIDTLKKAATNGKDFQSQLEKLNPTQKTYVGAMADMFGGTKSLQGALVLAANGGKDFTDTTKKIQDGVAGANGKIVGWAKVQEDFNFKMAKFRETIHVLFIELGTNLIPILSKVLDVLLPMLPTIVMAGGAILGLALAFKTVTLTMFLVQKGILALRTAWFALNFVFAASPVGLIIIGLVALGAAIFLIATKTKWFQELWGVVWRGIQTAFHAVMGFLKSDFGLLALALGPLGWLLLMAAHWKQIWGAIKDVATTVWHGLETAWRALWGVISAFAHGVWLTLQQLWAGFCAAFGPIWQAVSGPLAAAWNVIWTGISTIARGIWTVLSGAWSLFITTLSTIWQAVSGPLQASWNGIWTAISAVAKGIWVAMQAAWSAFITALSTIWQSVSGPLSAAWSGIWNAIKAVASAIWDELKRLWTAFTTDGILGVWKTISGQISSAWSTFWGDIKAVGQKIWDDIRGAIKTVFDGVKSDLDGIWTSIKGAATTMWNDLKTIVGDPVKFVVNTVIGGLANAWNTIAGAVGLSNLKVPVPNVSFAQGGTLPGYAPGVDSIPAMLSPGEGILVPEAVRGLGGAQFIDSVNSYFGGYRGAGNGAYPGIGFFQGGGVVAGSPFAAQPGAAATGGTGPTPTKPKHTGILGTGIGPNIGPSIPGANVVGAALKAAGNITSLILGFIGEAVINAIFAPFSAALGSIPGSPQVGQVAAKGTKTLIDEVIKFWVKKDADAAPKIGGVIPSGQHLAIIDAALAAAGVPPPGSKPLWETGMNTLISRESSWNAGAVNNTDSNAAAGHPSQGLAQMIPSTFAAYHVAGTSNNILDPVANVAAAIRYIVARYGNISNVQQANANMPPAGYGLGGLVRAYASGGIMSPGLSLVGENGAELVMGPRLAMALGGEVVAPLGRSTFSSALGEGYFGEAFTYPGATTDQSSHGGGGRRRGKWEWDRDGDNDDRGDRCVLEVHHVVNGKMVEKELVTLKRSRGGAKFQWEK